MGEINLEETTKASFEDSRLAYIFIGKAHSLSWNPTFSQERIVQYLKKAAIFVTMVASLYVILNRDKIVTNLGLESTLGLQQEKTYSPIKKTLDNPYKLKPKEFYQSVR